MSLQKISADRFSSLPDDILIHILSFLPTKQAIVASILSKRWIHLWRSVPILNFINTKVNSKEDNCRFIQFIKTNFLSPEEASATSHSIHTCLFNIQYNLANYDLLISLTYIGNWIKHVVEHNNVQYLSLQLQMNCRYPTSIFSSRTLVVLKLQTIYVDDVSPSPSRFPSLKTLHLNDIYFNKYSDFMLLLDGCPVLEDLQISYIDIVKSIDQFDFEHFENSSSLRKLNKAYISDIYCQFPIKVLSNLEFLHLKLYQDYLFNDFPTFHNLTHLAINYDCNLAVQVLQHCPKLRNLELYPKLKYARTVKYITKDDQELAPRCLSSSLTTCTIWNFASSTLESLIMLARFIMKKARVLETMTIWSDMKHFSEIERQLSSFPRASATCQLSIQIDIDDTPLF